MAFLISFILFFSLSVQAAFISDINILLGGNPPANNNPIPMRLSDGTNFISTLPVSMTSLPAFAATPTVNLGTLNGAALDRTTAASPSAVRLTDGTDFLAAFDMDNAAGISKALSVTLRGLANGTPVELGTTANPFRIDPTGTTTQPSRITDGTNNVLVTNTNPPASAFGLVTRSIPLNKATFVVVADAVAPGNNKSMVSIQNTGTSVVKIRRVYLTNVQTGTVTGVPIQFRLHRITSFTGGTAITPGTYDTADTLPAGITAATGATVAGESTFYKRADWSSDEWGSGTLDKEGFDQTFQQLFPIYYDLNEGKSITLRQNEAVHLRCATNTTIGSFNINVEFTTE